MNIRLKHIKPNYMETVDVSNSAVYLQEEVLFEQGKKYLIKANSGQGKSSLLNFIYGLNTNFEGEIHYNKTTDFSSRCKTKMSYIFQDFKLFPSLTIWENLVLKNELTQHKTDEAMRTMLQKVGLLAKKDQLIAELSLGQRQRIAIVRALCQPFEWLLLDEPFSHLDELNISALTTLINEELVKNNAGMLLTSLGSDYLFEYDKILKL
jgi:putative ABC transport system ATP-binding protein